jgi:hypothetical protein
MAYLTCHLFRGAKYPLRQQISLSQSLFFFLLHYILLLLLVRTVTAVEVIKAFDDYFVYMLSEIDRRERHLKQLNEVHQSRLPPTTIGPKVLELKRAAMVNQQLIHNFNDGNFYCERFNCYTGSGTGETEEMMYTVFLCRSFSNASLHLSITYPFYPL